MHTVAFTAYIKDIKSFKSSKLAHSMNQIHAVCLPASSETERLLITQQYQHRESVRRNTSVAGWIYAFSILKQHGSQPSEFMKIWNADCKVRGNDKAAITGRKKQAVELWLKHPQEMKIVQWPEWVCQFSIFLFLKSIM
jgi:hypothetical protein